MIKNILIFLLGVMPLFLYAESLEIKGSVWSLTSKNRVFVSTNIMNVKDSIINECVLSNDISFQELCKNIPDTVYSIVCSNFKKERTCNAFIYRLFFYRIKANDLKKNILSGRKNFNIEEVHLIDSLLYHKFPICDKYVYPIYSKRIYPYYNDYKERMLIVYFYIRKKRTPYEFLNYPYSFPAKINIDKKIVEDFDW